LHIGGWISYPLYFNVDEKYTFSEEEDREFMNHAVEKVAPIVRQHISKMQLIVDELLKEKKIAGERIKELLNGP
jgi:ATP-dependent Zn protease